MSLKCIFFIYNVCFLLSLKYHPFPFFSLKKKITMPWTGWEWKLQQQQEGEKGISTEKWRLSSPLTLNSIILVIHSWPTLCLFVDGCQWVTLLHPLTHTCLSYTHTCVGSQPASLCRLFWGFSSVYIVLLIGEQMKEVSRGQVRNYSFFLFFGGRGCLFIWACSVLKTLTLSLLFLCRPTAVIMSVSYLAVLHVCADKCQTC